MKIGERVTAELRTWHDGRPIEGWPHTQGIGTIRQLRNMAGVDYARVKYDSGRLAWEVLADLASVTVPTP